MAFGIDLANTDMRLVVFCDSLGCAGFDWVRPSSVRCAATLGSAGCLRRKDNIQDPGPYLVSWT